MADAAVPEIGYSSLALFDPVRRCDRFAALGTWISTGHVAEIRSRHGALPQTFFEPRCRMMGQNYCRNRTRSVLGKILDPLCVICTTNRVRRCGNSLLRCKFGETISISNQPPVRRCGRRPPCAG